MKPETKQRIYKSVKEVLPNTTKTCIWILKITIGVSFAMMLLKYFNLLPYISDAVSPFFKYFGLPGDASLAYVSGYFVNVYSAIAVISTLDLDVRAITILSTMILCSHSMVLEIAVLKKTGSSGVRMVIIRTFAAFFLGFMLNLILPGSATVTTATESITATLSFWATLYQWFLSALKLCIQMVLIIYTLNIIQRLLSEFGVMDYLAKFLRPLMIIFGLPVKTAFLWIVANIIGLGYGAAAMLDEISRGKLEKKEVQLLNSHICISHSNLEDLLLLTSLGATWWIMLLSRWGMSIILVWELRLEFYIRDILSRKKRTFAV
ncbi:MAG: nucleoside recognition domain-containing protein [Bacteroidales bacterium]|nr:nucleoside recognition domain-containing protein [Bacteroidales bacterium]MDD4669696.1 nucleoside recognition domain-containing protein [Bacteroidales bacterium]